MSIKKKIGLGILVLLLAIQFIRPARNEGNAAAATDITQVTVVSPEVKNILETSCYDCHSDHTVYPWYTNVQPVGWWLANHINEGKREVNFSQFAKYGITRRIRKYHEIAEQVKSDEMPLNSYLWIHHDAKLSEAQKKVLADWAGENEKTLSAQYPDSIPKKR